MKRIIFALTLAASPLAAENLTLFIVQSDGSVVAQEGNVTPQEAAALMEQQAPPASVTGLIIEPGKPARWTDLSARDVDLAFGGDGDVQIQATSQGTGASDTATTGSTAQAADASAITPAAGNWVGRVVAQNMQNCPAAANQVVAAQLSAYDGKPLAGTIDAAFHPTVMAPQFDWTKTGANTWLGAFVQDVAGAGIRIQWTVEVQSPDLISNRQQLKFSGALFGNCEANTEVDFVRNG